MPERTRNMEGVGRRPKLEMKNRGYDRLRQTEREREREPKELL